MRKGGIIAIQIEEGDELIDANLTDGDNEIVLITHEGMSIRFHEEELRDQGRNTVGVWGIRPEPGDYVVAIAVVDHESMLLVAGENGIGKRTPFDEYRTQSRGGKGIITMKTGDNTGSVVGALDRPRGRRADAHHQQRPDDPHPRRRDPRNRPQRQGRQTHRPAGKRMLADIARVVSQTEEDAPVVAADDDATAEGGGDAAPETPPPAS